MSTDRARVGGLTSDKMSLGRMTFYEMSCCHENLSVIILKSDPNSLLIQLFATNYILLNENKAASLNVRITKLFSTQSNINMYIWWSGALYSVQAYMGRLQASPVNFTCHEKTFQLFVKEKKRKEKKRKEKKRKEKEKRIKRKFKRK